MNVKESTIELNKPERTQIKGAREQDTEGDILEENEKTRTRSLIICRPTLNNVNRVIKSKMRWMWHVAHMR
jgi:hypothetical protein